MVQFGNAAKISEQINRDSVLATLRTTRSSGAPGNRVPPPCASGELARRHAPECVRRKPQDAEPEADRLLPGKRRARLRRSPRRRRARRSTRRRSPRSARRRCAHSLPRRLADAMRATSSSVTASPAPRKPAPMMRTRSRASSRPAPKRSASATRSSAPNAASSSASAPSVSTSVRAHAADLGLDLAAMKIGHALRRRERQLARRLQRSS